MLYVRSPEVMKRLALSYDALAADVYWIRAVSALTADAQASPTRQRLRPAVSAARPDDVARSALQHRLPIRRIFLSEQPPGGPGRPDQAIALLQKGIEAQPEKWSTAGHRLRLLLVGPTTSGPRTGSSARQRRRRAVVAEAAGRDTLAQGGNRQASRAAV